MGYQEDQQEKKDFWIDLGQECKRKQEQQKLPSEIVSKTRCPQCGKERSPEEFFNPCNVNHNFKKCGHCRSTNRTGKVTSAQIDKLYRSIKNSAESRGLMFDLPMGYFSRFWRKPCYYCGTETWTIGLDRADNTKGYIVGNVVSCCGTCNMMKRAMSFEAFVEHAVKVYKNLKLEDILTYQSCISEAAVRHHSPFIE